MLLISMEAFAIVSGGRWRGDDWRPHTNWLGRVEVMGWRCYGWRLKSRVLGSRAKDIDIVSSQPAWAGRTLQLHPAPIYKHIHPRYPATGHETELILVSLSLDFKLTGKDCIALPHYFPRLTRVDHAAHPSRRGLETETLDPWDLGFGLWARVPHTPHAIRCISNPTLLRVPTCHMPYATSHPTSHIPHLTK